MLHLMGLGLHLMGLQCEQDLEIAFERGNHVCYSDLVLGFIIVLVYLNLCNN